MKLKIKDTAMTAAGLVAGSVAANFMNNKLSAKITNPKLLAAAPLAVGIFLSMQKNGMLKNVGYGMMANGGSRLVGQLVPGLAGLTGIGDDIFGVYDEIVSGIGVDELGEIEGVGEMDGLGAGVLNGFGAGVLNGMGGPLQGFGATGDGNDF